MTGEPISNQQQQQICHPNSDEDMDDYDRELVEEFKMCSVGVSNVYQVKDPSFDDLMKLIDGGNYSYMQPSFLRVSSNDYDFYKKLKQEKEEKKKDLKKDKKMRDQLEKEEVKHNPTKKPLDQIQFEKDVKELSETFKNFDKEVIEDILHEKVTIDEAFEALTELEAQVVHQQEEDIISQFQDIDNDYLQDDFMQQKIEDIERDRLLAEKISQEEDEEEKNEDIVEALGINDEELTNLRIQEKLREFLFNYRFEEKRKRLQNKKNIVERDQQMKKIKRLKASEQHVFKQFLDQLQIECFDLLMLKHQQLQKNDNNPENIANSNGKVSPSKQSWKEQQQKPIVQIHNTKEFPSLIDDKVIQKINAKRIREYKMEMHKQDGFQQIHKNFNAQTTEQLEKLIQISNSFISLDHELIQETYDLINDAEQVYILLQMAFPALHKVQDTRKIDQVFKNLDKLSNHQQGRRQKKANGQSQGKAFFTSEVLRRFKYQNYQRQSANTMQGVYEEARKKAQQIYARRQHFLQEIKKAKKSGNHQQMEYAKKQADLCTQEYEQAQQNGQLQIFSLKNGNIQLMDQYIDLHGMHLQEALRILSLRLNQIQVDLNNGSLQPNIDQKNHVLKIVCGRGIHSKGRAVLKYKIPEYLDQRNYEYYNLERDGVVLVRFKKQ